MGCRVVISAGLPGAGVDRRCGCRVMAGAGCRVPGAGVDRRCGCRVMAGAGCRGGPALWMKGDVMARRRVPGSGRVPGNGRRRVPGLPGSARRRGKG